MTRARTHGTGMHEILRAFFQISSNRERADFSNDFETFSFSPPRNIRGRFIRDIPNRTLLRKYRSSRKKDKLNGSSSRFLTSGNLLILCNFTISIHWIYLAL